MVRLLAKAAAVLSTVFIVSGCNWSPTTWTPEQRALAAKQRDLPGPGVDLSNPRNASVGDQLVTIGVGLRVVDVQALPEQIGRALAVNVANDTGEATLVVFGRKGWCRFDRSGQVLETAVWPESVARAAAGCESMALADQGRAVVILAGVESLSADLRTGRVIWRLADARAEDRRRAGPISVVMVPAADGRGPYVVYGNQYEGVFCFRWDGSLSWKDDGPERPKVFTEVNVAHGLVAYGRGGTLIVRRPEGEEVFRKRIPADAKWVRGVWEPMACPKSQDAGKLWVTTTRPDNTAWGGIVDLTSEPPTWRETSASERWEWEQIGNIGQFHRVGDLTLATYTFHPGDHASETRRDAGWRSVWLTAVDDNCRLGTPLFLGEHQTHSDWTGARWPEAFTPEPDRHLRLMTDRTVFTVRVGRDR